MEKTGKDLRGGRGPEPGEKESHSSLIDVLTFPIESLPLRQASYRQISMEIKK